SRQSPSRGWHGHWPRTVQMSMRPLAVFGGTFDPIHIGHLTVAWEAAELLDAEVRLVLDARELERDGPSYTIDTLRELRAEQGGRPLVLLLGADAFAGLPGWNRWRELFEFAHIGVLSRPGSQVTRAAELVQEVASRRVDDVASLRATPCGKLIELAVTPLEVSATRIRELLAAGRDPRYLLPAGLFDDPALLRPYRLKP